MAIGLAIDGWGGDADLECVAEGFDEPISTRLRLNPEPKQ